jgi:hypothetical protein
MWAALVADAEVSSLEAAAAAAAAVGAAAVAAPAGHGHHSAGSTVAGVSPRLGQKYPMYRRSNPHKQQRLREKETGISLPHEPNSGLRTGTQLSFAQQLRQLRHVGRDPLAKIHKLILKFQTKLLYSASYSLSLDGQFTDQQTRGLIDYSGFGRRGAHAVQRERRTTRNCPLQRSGQSRVCT